jgi:hypothetical protein
MVWLSTEDHSSWPLSLVGFGMVSDQLDACRRHHRTTRLQTGTDA